MATLAQVERRIDPIVFQNISGLIRDGFRSGNQTFFTLAADELRSTGVHRTKALADKVHEYGVRRAIRRNALQLTSERPELTARVIENLEHAFLGKGRIRGLPDDVDAVFRHINSLRLIESDVLQIRMGISFGRLPYRAAMSNAMADRSAYSDKVVAVHAPQSAEEASKELGAPKLSHFLLLQRNAIRHLKALIAGEKMAQDWRNAAAVAGLLNVLRD